MSHSNNAHVVLEVGRQLHKIYKKLSLSVRTIWISPRTKAKLIKTISVQKKTFLWLSIERPTQIHQFLSIIARWIMFHLHVNGCFSFGDESIVSCNEIKVTETSQRSMWHQSVGHYCTAMTWNITNIMTVFPILHNYSRRRTPCLGLGFVEAELS